MATQHWSCKSSWGRINLVLLFTTECQHCTGFKFTAVKFNCKLEYWVVGCQTNLCCSRSFFRCDFRL